MDRSPQTIQGVYDTLTKPQKDALHRVIGELIECGHVIATMTVAQQTLIRYLVDQTIKCNGTESPI